MQFTTLVNAVLVLALAHVGAVVGSPAGLQDRAECSLVCVNDAECVDCLGVTAALGWTCNVLGVPGAQGLCVPLVMQFTTFTALALAIAHVGVMTAGASVLGGRQGTPECPANVPCDTDYDCAFIACPSTCVEFNPSLGKNQNVQECEFNDSRGSYFCHAREKHNFIWPAMDSFGTSADANVGANAHLTMRAPTTDVSDSGGHTEPAAAIPTRLFRYSNFTSQTKMQFSVLVSFVLALAQIGVAMGNPSRLQARDDCDVTDCKLQIDCNQCPGVLSGTQWTCVTEGSPLVLIGVAKVGECFLETV
ncbi:hypothetical protein VTO73DRAFT_12031 [Trametes versicolor]